MKKILFTFSIAVALSMMLAGTASAWGTDSITAGSGTGTLIMRTSKFVYLEFHPYAPGAVGTAYSIGTYHASGNRTFGSGSVDTKLYFQETASPPGSASIDDPTDSVTSVFASPWLPL